MAKPIFIIELPHTASVNLENEVQETVQDKMPDYHVFCVRSFNEQLSFQCFNPETMPDIDIEQLRELIYSTKGNNIK